MLRPVTAEQLVGDVVERDRGRTGQLQLAGDVAREGYGGDVGDVPRVDHRDLRARARQEDRPGLAHAVGRASRFVIRNVGLQQDVVDAARAQVLPDAAVRVGESDRRPDRDVDRGQLDDAPHTRRRRCVDQRVLPGRLGGVVGAGQIDGVDAVDGRAERAAVAEVADDEVDIRPEQLGRPRPVPHERPYRQAAVAQLRDEVATDGAGRADGEDGDGHAGAPVGGAVFAPRCRDGAPGTVPAAFLSAQRRGTPRRRGGPRGPTRRGAPHREERIRRGGAPARRRPRRPPRRGGCAPGSRAPRARGSGGPRPGRRRRWRRSPPSVRVRRARRGAFQRVDGERMGGAFGVSATSRAVRRAQLGFVVHVEGQQRAEEQRDAGAERLRDLARPRRGRRRGPAARRREPPRNHRVLPRRLRQATFGSWP